MITLLMLIECEETRNKLEEIFVTFYKDMFITAYSILKDHHEAEDIVQEAILRLSKHLDKISEVKCRETRAYVVIIVRNLAINTYNKRSSLILLESYDVKTLNENEVFLIENHMIRIELSKEIAEHLENLHPTYADILTLKYYYELSISEIGDLLGITENNASVRLSRARLAFKEMIEKKGVDYEKSV
ncbi:RNA polymerase sigma factor [Fusibacter sp. 3D3]|uniref:RNA polymerase sigma factor n=1 Tax=Fusibacter sp. 3D3 TaxID=1048380 RepID=UPI00085347AF|nr:RNA polymerase sigma factor [Fusibacter sp. 3D3]GAU76648.1 RNA polymerase sigma factor SigW [Fusibacter sp. 3D3]